MTVADRPPTSTGDLLRPRDIIGNAEVRKLCGGVTRHTLLRWRRAEGFPEPIRRLQCGELWDRRAIRAWLDER